MMSITATAKYLPAPRLAIVTASDGRRCVCGGIASQEAAEAAAQDAVARWNAADAEAAAREAEREAKRQAWDADRAAEEIAQKIAKAAAVPSFSKALVFLKLIKHKETCPLFDEVLVEMERLRDADAKAEEEDR